MSSRLLPSRGTIAVPLIALLALTSAGCSRARSDNTSTPDVAGAQRVAGQVLLLTDTVVPTLLEVSGTAMPLRQATLSTKLMGTVTTVSVHAGDAVRAGQILVQLDARDLSAKATQVAAGIADAEAMQADAATQASRMRALYADSAATRAQYDAAMTGLARTDAGLRAARAAAGEVAAMRSYAEVRAPFAGVVTARLVDPGSFAAPGTPLITVQDVSALRVSVAAAGETVRGLQRGSRLAAKIDGADATAIVEGIVPTASGNLFTVNATVANAAATYRAGSAATLRIPAGSQHALLVPVTAIVRDGDLTGVVVHGVERDERRWIRLGATRGTQVEVAGGLRAGESIVVPTTARPGA